MSNKHKPFKPDRELKRAVNNYWMYAVEHSKCHMNREERRRTFRNGKIKK